MAYLKLKQSCMEKTESSLKREFLETGFAGTVCNSSVHCLHTRKYHGLFIYEDAGIDGEFHSLLSNLEVIIDDSRTVYNLGGYFYPGNDYPEAAELNKEFTVSPVSEIVSQCDNLKVTREFVTDSKARRVHIRIGVLGEGRKSVKIVLRPYLTFRNLHRLIRSNMDCSTKYRAIEKGIAVRLYSHYPELLMQLSKKK